jgi:hypothetical protein
MVEFLDNTVIHRPTSQLESSWSAFHGINLSSLSGAVSLAPFSALYSSFEDSFCLSLSRLSTFCVHGAFFVFLSLMAGNEG